MNLLLSLSKPHLQSEVKISGSKSETNRLLLLRALYPNLILENTSDSDDSKVMQAAFATTSHTIDIHHAGTAMRFLTAYFAVYEGSDIVLTGSPRMQERPIKILVDALRQLGAEIHYENNEGFPPLRIKGKKLSGSPITIDANMSSQYISALLLIAPKLENGIEIKLEGEITSRPYIEMTLALLHKIGVNIAFDANKITVSHLPFIMNPAPYTLTVESDWSSASYFYSIVALSETGTQITLSTFKSNGLQGDSVLSEIYRSFGVETTFGENQITLRKANIPLSAINYQLQNTPDLAQTIAVTAFGLGLKCHLTGLHTLKIKETDRLEALRIELTKLGAKVSITADGLSIQASSQINPHINIQTYSDHRMAMAFAPLALRVPIIIEDAEVVSKSYPAFWTDLQTIGFKISEI